MKVTYRVVIGTLMLFATALVVTSIVTNNWVRWTKDATVHCKGLWKTCVAKDDHDCVKLPTKEKTIYLQATKVLMITTAVCMFGGVFYVIIASFIGTLQPWILVLIAFTGDITLVIAASLYTINIRLPEPTWKFGFSFGLAWVSVLPTLIVFTIVIVLWLLNGRKDLANNNVQE